MGILYKKRVVISLDEYLDYQADYYGSCGFSEEQILQNLKRICEGYKVNISLVKEELKQKALSGVFNASKISK